MRKYLPRIGGPSSISVMRMSRLDVLLTREPLEAMSTEGIMYWLFGTRILRPESR